MDVNFKDIIYEKDNLIYLKDKRIAELEKAIDRVITYIDFACYDMSLATKTKIINTLRGKEVK